MKRLAILAVTAVTALAPIAAAPASAAPPHAYGYERNHDNRHDNRRDARSERRWDRRQDNGYTLNGRWYYGAPPASAYHARDFRPGYRAWQRGERVPAYYRDRAHRVDYRQYRNLRAPPRGYEYIRDDRGTVLLVGIATGVILSAILAQ